jgi:CspA family cold shock protein
MSELRREGKVKWFDDARGYGFLDIGDGIDVFVHQTSIEKDGYRTLAENERVSFVLRDGAKGRQAVEVRSL